jgi:hypothetical protein
VKVALVSTKRTARADHLLACFGRGLRAHGDKPVNVRDRADIKLLESCDVAVQVCFVNRRHGGLPVDLFRVQVYDRLKKAGKRLAVIDTGFVGDQYAVELRGRKFDPDKPATFPAFDDVIYYQVGFDGIKGTASYHNKNSPPDRWEALNVPILPWRESGEHVVILGQARRGQSSQHTDILRWYGRAARTVRKFSDRKLLFRSHPRISTLRTNKARIAREKAKIMAEIGPIKNFSFSRNTHLPDDLKDCWAAVAFSTTAAVSAVLAGIPVFAYDQACMAWPVSAGPLDRVERPDTPAREQWAYNMAYAQWTCAEMTSGACWKHLRPHALGKPRYPENI